jgi:signal transduction histidine kinase
MWRRVPRRLQRSPHPLREPFVDAGPSQVLLAKGPAPAASTRVESPSSVAVSEDRERIAADLHDTVIQQLYATGLGLQACLSLLHGADGLHRIEAAIGQIDDVIHHIRSTIFDLGSVGDDALDDQGPTVVAASADAANS